MRKSNWLCVQQLFHIAFSTHTDHVFCDCLCRKSSQGLLGVNLPAEISRFEAFNRADISAWSRDRQHTVLPHHYTRTYHDSTTGMIQTVSDVNVDKGWLTLALCRVDSFWSMSLRISVGEKTMSESTIRFASPVWPTVYQLLPRKRRRRNSQIVFPCIIQNHDWIRRQTSIHSPHSPSMERFDPCSFYQAAWCEVVISEHSRILYIMLLQV